MSLPQSDGTTLPKYLITGREIGMLLEGRVPDRLFELEFSSAHFPTLADIVGFRRTQHSNTENSDEKSSGNNHQPQSPPAIGNESFELATISQQFVQSCVGACVSSSGASPVHSTKHGSSAPAITLSVDILGGVTNLSTTAGDGEKHSYLLVPKLPNTRVLYSGADSCRYVCLRIVAPDGSDTPQTDSAREMFVDVSKSSTVHGFTHPNGDKFVWSSDVLTPSCISRGRGEQLYRKAFGSSYYEPCDASTKSPVVRIRSEQQAQLSTSRTAAGSTASQLLLSEAPLKFDQKWGSRGSAEGQFSEIPRMLCPGMDAWEEMFLAWSNKHRRLFVCDHGNQRVQAFEESPEEGFEFIAQVGNTCVRGAKPGQFYNPYQICVDDETSQLLVADSQNRRIQIFSVSDSRSIEFVREIQTDFYVRGVCCTRGCEKIFACGGDDQIHVICGASFKTLGKHCEEIAYVFKGVNSMAFDNVTRELYVTDFRNNCVVVLDEDCRYLRHFGQSALKHPVQVHVVERSGEVLVADWGNHCVRVFNGRRRKGDSEDAPPRTIGERKGNLSASSASAAPLCSSSLSSKARAAGAEDGTMCHPTGVCTDFDRRIFVGDADNYRIQVFK